MFLLPLLSAALWILSFVHYRSGFLVLVSLIPLLWFLDLAQAKKLARKKVLGSVWFTSFLSFLGVMAWILSTHPGTWAGIDQKVPTVFVVLVWLLSALVMSTGPLIFALLLALFKKLPLYDWKILLILPGAWIIGEYIRSWLFSIVWYGAGATIGPHWNFGNLGLGLAATPLLPISRLLGLYGLSFVAVVSNIALFWLLKKRFRQSLTIFFSIAALLAVTSLGFRISSKNLQVAAVQLENAQLGYNDRLKAFVESKQAPGANLVVFPEYADFLNTQHSESAQPVLGSIFQGKKGVGIESQAINDSDITQSKQRIDRSYYYNEHGAVLAQQDKTFLIPNGEFLTGVTRWLLDNTGHDTLVSTFNTSRALQKADKSEQVINAEGLRVGSIACSGIVSPELYRRLANQQTDVLANTASLGIFRSDEYFQQSKALARFDAVANNKPFVQATRDGYSYIISSNGAFVAETKHKNMDYLTANVRISNGKTPYSRFGEAFLCLTTVLLLVSILKEKNIVKTKHN